MGANKANVWCVLFLHENLRATAGYSLNAHGEVGWAAEEDQYGQRAAQQTYLTIDSPAVAVQKSGMTNNIGTIGVKKMSYKNHPIRHQS